MRVRVPFAAPSKTAGRWVNPSTCFSLVDTIDDTNARFVRIAKCSTDEKRPPPARGQRGSLYAVAVDAAVRNREEVTLRKEIATEEVHGATASEPGSCRGKDPGGLTVSGGRASETPPAGARWGGRAPTRYAAPGVR